MEPRNDESQKVPEPRTEERKRRFRIIKLEERIAPARCTDARSRDHGHSYNGAHC